MLRFVPDAGRNCDRRSAAAVVGAPRARDALGSRPGALVRFPIPGARPLS